MTSWDERYRSGERIDSEPAPVLVRAAQLLPPGAALDLACGTGRHALYLAERGWRVTAVDASAVAIQMLAGRSPTIDARVVDLEAWFSIEPDSFDLICDLYYLQRSLFPQLRAGVRPGGLAVCAIHLVSDAPGIQPMNPAYLLEPGELRGFFAGWTLLHDYEGGQPHRRPVAEIIAQRPA